MTDMLFTIQGVPVTTCTQGRIRPEEQKEHHYYYHIRHEDEDWGEPYSLEKRVWVNHFASIETTEPIPYLEENNENNRAYVELTEEDKENILQNL